MDTPESLAREIQYERAKLTPYQRSLLDSHLARFVRGEFSREYFFQELGDYYYGWSEHELRCGIHSLQNGMHIKGVYSDIELLRIELRRRGLCDLSYSEMRDQGISCD